MGYGLPVAKGREGREGGVGKSLSSLSIVLSHSRSIPVNHRYAAKRFRER
jgi:hypothetical protein